MRLWRISRFSGLSGIGGMHANGRWHHAPRLALYAAEHPALALVEVLAHLRVTLDAMPTSLRLIAIDVKARASQGKTPDLPSGWQANEPTTQGLGDAFLDGGSALMLKVPSAILPSTYNFLINPGHAQAATHLSEVDEGPLWIDPRLAR
jgi:RES domain-containing protein